MDSTTREDIIAATAVHRELGPDYEDAVAESLVERISAEIDKRVDTRLAQRGQPVASAAVGPARSPWPPVVLALGSMIVGLVATVGITVAAIGTTGEAVGLSSVIWIAIAIVNIAYSRRR